MAFQQTCMDMMQWLAVQAFMWWAWLEQLLHQAHYWLLQKYPCLAEKTVLIWSKQGDIFKQLTLTGVPQQNALPLATEYDLQLAKIPVPISPGVVTSTTTHYIVRPVNGLALESALQLPKVSKGVRFYSVRINVHGPNNLVKEYNLPMQGWQLAVVNNKLFDTAFNAFLLSTLQHVDYNPDNEQLHVTFIGGDFKPVTLKPNDFVIVRDDKYDIVRSEPTVFVGQ